MDEDVKNLEPNQSDEKKEKKAKDRTIPAFVLGIISIVLIFFGTKACLGSIACGIVGLVFSVKTKKSGTKRRLLNAAFVLSIIGLSLGATSFLSFISCEIMSCILNKFYSNNAEIVNFVVDNINKLIENLVNGIVNVHIHY